MTHYKTRGVQKRKLDTVIPEKEKKLKKKVNENDDLISKFKDLQKRHDSLINEHKENLELIEKLNGEINLLKTQRPLKKDLMTKDSQTMYHDDSKDTLKIEFPCKHCIFVGNCEDELRWHLTNAHKYPDPDHYGKDSCLDCGKLFDTKCEIMIHRKECHPDLIKSCSYFMEGKCAFEEKYWYSHKNIKSTIVKEFKCRFDILI